MRASFLLWALLPCAGCAPGGPTPAGPAPNRDAGGSTCDPWPLAELPSGLMLPGQACLECHETSRGSAEELFLGGTVFAERHVPDDCAGVPEVTVVVEDVAGRVVTVRSNASGNFYSRDLLEPPLTARVEQGGVIVEMEAPVDTGDCNACHTERGRRMAPGRIVAPLGAP